MNESLRCGLGEDFMSGARSVSFMLLGVEQSYCRVERSEGVPFVAH